MKRLGIAVVIGREEAAALLYEIDANSDGKVSPLELLACLRKLAAN
jgi:hypothetical protein